MTRETMIERLERVRARMARFVSYNPFRPSQAALDDVDAVIDALRAGSPTPEHICGRCGSRMHGESKGPTMLRWCPKCLPDFEPRRDDPYAPPSVSAEGGERCECGHERDAHDHHTVLRGTPAKYHCAQCGCRSWRPARTKEEKDGLPSGVSRGSRGGADVGRVEDQQEAGPMTDEEIERLLVEHQKADAGPWCVSCADYIDAPWCPVVRLAREVKRLREELQSLYAEAELGPPCLGEGHWHKTRVGESICALTFQWGRAERERNAYKKAKAENDERLMRERDEALLMVSERVQTLHEKLRKAERERDEARALADQLAEMVRLGMDHGKHERRGGTGGICDLCGLSWPCAGHLMQQALAAYDRARKGEG